MEVTTIWYLLFVAILLDMGSFSQYKPISNEKFFKYSKYTYYTEYCQHSQTILGPLKIQLSYDHIFDQTQNVDHIF